MHKLYQEQRRGGETFDNNGSTDPEEDPFNSLDSSGSLRRRCGPMGRQTSSDSFLRRSGEVKCSSPEDGVQWLREQGWEAEASPSQMEVLIPAKFDQIYESYNDIQKGQGFDIARYQGETVTKYTYLVKNYPGEPDGVAANLLVYEGRLIGADLCSLELGGFLKGVKGAGGG